VYIRLSSQSQAWGDGERRQHDAAVRFVETHSLPVAETMQDIGVSAFRGDNALTGELGRFLQRCESGEVPPGSVLVAESLDRLTRDRVNQALLLLLNITQHGVRIGLTAQNVILDLALRCLLPNFGRHDALEQRIRAQVLQIPGELADEAQEGQGRRHRDKPSPKLA